MNRITSVLVYAALLILLCSDVALLRANHTLSVRLGALQHTDGPAIGQAVGTLSGNSIDGRAVVIKPSQANRPALLLLFTPTCPYCKQNWPIWSELVKRMPGQTNVVWGDLSGTASRDFLVGHGIQPSDENTVQVSAESRDIYSLHVTPTTVLLGEDGRVRRVWLGVLTEKDVAEIVSLSNKSGAA